MRKVTLLFILSFIALSLMADEINLRPTYNLTLYPFHIPTDDGQIVFWSHAESGQQQVYCQKLNFSGNPMWNNDIPLVSAMGNWQLMDAVPSQDGTFFVAFKKYDYIAEQSEVRLQRVTVSGDILWGDGGVTVSLVDSSEYVHKVKLVANLSGGVFAVWQSQDMERVSAQCYDGTGNPLWVNNVSYGFNGNSEERLETLLDEEGGILVQADTNIHNITASGNIVGNAPVVTSSIMSGSMITLLPAGNGEFILWNKGGANNALLRLIRINRLGEVLGSGIEDYSIGTSDCDKNVRVLSNANGDVFAAWVNNNTLKMQRFNSELIPQWQESGITVSAGAITPEEFYIAIDSSDNTWLSWMQDEGGIVNRATKISSTGSQIWPEGGLLVHQGNDLAIPIPISGASTFMWSSSQGIMDKIQRQHINSDGLPLYSENELILLELAGGLMRLYDPWIIDDDLISMWWEIKGDHRKLRLQRTDQMGVHQWGDFGTLLVDDESYRDQLQRTVKDANDRIWCLYTTSPTNPQGEPILMYLQRLNADGTKELPGFGLPITTYQGFEARYCMTLIDDDVYVLWETGNMIMGQRIHDDQKLWGDDGRVLYTADASMDIDLWDLRQNYLIWSEGIDSNKLMKVLKLDSDGNVATGWSMEGMYLFGGEQINHQEYVSAGLLSDDLYCIVSGNLTSSGMEQFRIQKISPSGQLPWQESGIVLNMNFQFAEVLSPVYSDEISFLAREYDDYGVHLRFVKLSPEGTFTTETILPFPGLSVPMDARLARFTDGSYICVSECRSIDGFQAPDLFYHMISPTGELLTPSSVALCVAPGSQYSLKLAAFGNKAFVSWLDDRKGLSGIPISEAEPYAYLINSTYTSVVDHEHELVDRLSLESIYPNPFNPETRISFHIPQSGVPKIAIYNMKGQLVKNLSSDCHFPAGHNTIGWNGTDQSGEIVSSGVYFCRVSFRDRSTIRKMILAK